MIHIKHKITSLINRVNWKRKNKHNFTHLISVDGDSINSVTVGNGTYGGIYVLAHAQNSRLKIGSFCSIAPNVTFILGSEHGLNKLSTYPFKVNYLGINHEAETKGDIIIDDDVWIGFGATILSGVHIGQGAVISAGALVSKDVEPYSIVGGVPAKVIKYRFDSETIDYFLSLDYEKLDKELINKHIEEIYNSSIMNNSIDKNKQIFSWFPKKENYE